MARPKTVTFECSCIRICRGKKRKLSRSAYYKHKKAEKAEMKRLRERQNAPPAPGTARSTTTTQLQAVPGASGSSQRAADPAQVDEAMDGVFEQDYNTFLDLSSSDEGPVPLVHTQVDENAMQSDQHAGHEHDGTSPDTVPHVPSTAAQPSQDHSGTDGRTWDALENDQMQQDGDDRGSMYLSLPLDPKNNAQDPDSPLQSELQALALSEIHLEDLRSTQALVDGIKNARLRDGHLPERVLNRLLNPPQSPLVIDDDKLRFSLDIWYTLLDNASEDAYYVVKRTLERHPSSNIEMLSLNEVRTQVEHITGVVPIYEDMCPSGCICYAGPYAEKTKCPVCTEDRYEKQLPNSRSPPKPRKQSLTIPLGPQLQALFRSPEMAETMQYRHKAVSAAAAVNYNMETLEDWVRGTDPLEAAVGGDLHEDSIALFYGTDGCQLIQDKQSNCWLAVWVVADFSPDKQCKKRHVLVSNVIPGPKKPKNFDSFMFTSFRHLSALQRDKLSVWDASRCVMRYKTPFFVFGTADSPAMAVLSGRVGHTGRIGSTEY